MAMQDRCKMEVLVVKSCCRSQKELQNLEAEFAALEEGTQPAEGDKLKPQDELQRDKEVEQAEVTEKPSNHVEVDEPHICRGSPDKASKDDQPATVRLDKSAMEPKIIKRRGVKLVAVSHDAPAAVPKTKADDPVAICALAPGPVSKPCKGALQDALQGQVAKEMTATQASSKDVQHQTLLSKPLLEVSKCTTAQNSNEAAKHMPASRQPKSMKQTADKYVPTTKACVSGKSSKKDCVKPCAKSAYQLFCDEKRGSVKSSLPEGANAFKDVSSALGAMWRALPAAEKSGFQDKCAQEKSDNQGASEHHVAKKAGRSRTKRTSAKQYKPYVPPSAFMLFCAAAKVSGDPEACRRAWDGLSAAERNEFEAEAKALRDAELAKMERIMLERQEQATVGDELNMDAPSFPPSNNKRKPARSQPSRKRSRSGNKELNEDSKREPDTAAVGSATTDESDDEDDEWGWSSDMEADMIISHSLDGTHFVVACKDKALDACGLVDACMAKQQRSTGANESCPLSLDMIQEYESFQKRFKEGQHMLSKADPKSMVGGDKMIRLPAMALSFVTQRMVDSERQKRAVLERQLALAKKLLQAHDKLCDLGAAAVRHTWYTWATGATHANMRDEYDPCGLAYDSEGQA
eukprot:362452-Chlamydomonas_euryale.AAC.5